MAKEYKFAYLSYMTITADSEREAQRKLVDYLEACPDNPYRLFGRFMPLEEAFFQFRKLDGFTDEKAREFVEKIKDTLVNPE